MTDTHEAERTPSGAAKARRDLPGPYIKYLQRLIALREIRERIVRLQDRVAYLEAEAAISKAAEQ
jgi:hypothetical protein